MNTLKILPEGWNNEITRIDLTDIGTYLEYKETLQGLVKKCDEKYNLYVDLGNGLLGKMPREEVEAINLDDQGLPKVNLCTGKVHKFIQFKIKEFNEENVILSRKSVQVEALHWVKNDLKEGQRVSRNS